MSTKTRNLPDLSKVKGKTPDERDAKIAKIAGIVDAALARMIPEGQSLTHGPVGGTTGAVLDEVRKRSSHHAIVYFVVKQGQKATKTRKATKDVVVAAWLTREAARKHVRSFEGKYVGKYKAVRAEAFAAPRKAGGA